MESDRVHARAVIMREGVDREDAANAEGGWLSWLRDCGVPALTGVDTRALVRHIRDKGAMRGGVFAADTPEAEARERVHAEPSMSGLDLAREVSPREPLVIEGSGPRVIALDTGIKGSIVRNLRDSGRAPGAAPMHHDRGRAARPRPRRRLPGQRPGRPRRARLRRRGRARGGRQGPCLGDLPGPPAALPRRRPRDVQAPLRPSRRQPPGQGPGDRPDRDHLPEPWLRGARPGRRADDRRGRAGALGDGLRRRRAPAAEPLRPHRGGPGAARRAGLHRAVPPRGGTGPARRTSSLRPLRRTACRVGTTSRRSSWSAPARS